MIDPVEIDPEVLGEHLEAGTLPEGEYFAAAVPTGLVINQDGMHISPMDGGLRIRVFKRSQLDPHSQEVLDMISRGLVEHISIADRPTGRST